MVEFFMMSAKLATPSLLKVKVFLNKGYDVTTSVCNVTNKVLLCDSIHSLDVVM